MNFKHAIISSPQPNWNSTVASNMLQLVHFKYTHRLPPGISIVQLSRIKELRYLKLVLFDGCNNELQIVELTKNVALFSPDTAIIFTCNKMCNSLKEDNRFNVIELG